MCNEYINTTTAGDYSIASLKETIEKVKDLDTGSPSDWTESFMDAEGNLFIVDSEMYYAVFDTAQFYPNHVSAEIVYSDFNATPLEEDIKALKKRIKHAKSLLERKQLQNQLNEAYKKAKKEKRK